jgi:hypothetical protein
LEVDILGPENIPTTRTKLKDKKGQDACRKRPVASIVALKEQLLRRCGTRTSGGASGMYVVLASQVEHIQASGGCCSISH